MNKRFFTLLSLLFAVLFVNAQNSDVEKMLKGIKAVASFEKIEKAITEELGIADGETTSDGLFTLKNVACLGCCSLSPVMMINDETYGSLTPEKAKEILKNLKAKED